jgi:outer membrane receptor protein involved in Fe transport
MLRAHHVPVAVAELEWLLFTAGLALLWRGFAWLVYNVINGLPTTLTMYGNHGARNPFQMNTTAFYAEEQWTGGRLTLQGGLRYEQIGSY